MRYQKPQKNEFYSRHFTEILAYNGWPRINEGLSFVNISSSFHFFGLCFFFKRFSVKFSTKPYSNERHTGESKKFILLILGAWNISNFQGQNTVF